MNAADNAAMESLWLLLQKNVLNQQRRWQAPQDLRLAIVTWVERRYRQREQDALGGLTPIEFETTMEPAANLAA